MTTRADRMDRLKKLAKERILILDGAMGTALQKLKLQEEDYRKVCFQDHGHELKGNADAMNLSNPDVIQGVYRAYYEAGADIIETNTFSATPISQEDYGLEDRAYDIAFAGAKLARDLADELTAENPDRPRFVAGSMGPTNKTLSVSPKVEDPGYRAISFDEMKEAYRQNASGLLDGGADYLLIETIFDTLNAKAAIMAVEELKEERGEEIEVVLSVTITDKSGRTLSGQTVEAFWYSIRHAKPLAVGMNCAFGAADLRPFITALSEKADTLICAYPNAGLPNELGAYTETPDMTASELCLWADAGLLNIVGGCCGTTPDHIAAIAKAMTAYKPRQIPTLDTHIRLSGLEPMIAAG